MIGPPFLNHFTPEQYPIFDQMGTWEILKNTLIMIDIILFNETWGEAKKQWTVKDTDKPCY